MIPGLADEKTGLLRELPPIVRVRDYHLYDLKRKRYLDCYQNGGRAILGHRPQKLSRDLKDLISKGLYAELPSIWEKHLERALSTLFPAYQSFRVFSSLDRACAAAAELVEGPTEKVLQAVIPRDPVSTRRYGDYRARGTGIYRKKKVDQNKDQNREAHLMEKIAIWRPFYPDEVFSDYLLPIIPFPGRWAPQVLCIRDHISDEYCPSDIVSPLLLRALVSVIAELRKAIEAEPSWADLPFWKRSGPYLLPSCREADYPNVFRLFLSNGVLLSPLFTSPTILPGYYSEGEWKLLEKLSSICYKKNHHDT